MRGLADNKKYNVFFLALAVVCLLLSVVGVVSALNNDGVVKVIMLVCSGLLVLLAGIYLLAVVLSRDAEPNFFLYDNEQRRNIPLSKLSVEAVISRLDEFVEDMGGVETLMRGRTLSEGNFGVGAVLRPLVAYRIIMSAAESDNAFMLLDRADDKIIGTLCRALETAGEQDMPKAILRYRQNGGDTERFKHFLCGNNKYIRGRIMAYIKRNLEQFY